MKKYKEKAAHVIKSLNLKSLNLNKLNGKMHHFDIYKLKLHIETFRHVIQDVFHEIIKRFF